MRCIRWNVQAALTQAQQERLGTRKRESAEGNGSFFLVPFILNCKLKNSP